MSKKTKCCKEYKRSGKYCRTCPLKRGGQFEKTDSRQAAKGFFASVTEIILNAEISAGVCSTRLSATAADFRSR